MHATVQAQVDRLAVNLSGSPEDPGGACWWGGWTAGPPA
jgi:hypothetical protein